MSAFRFEWSQSTGRPVWIGVLLASAMLAPPSLAAPDDKPPKPSSGLMSLEELHRDIRLRIRKLAEAVLADEKRWQESVEIRIGPRIKGGGEEAVYRQAKLAREIAELASREYKEVAAPLEHAKLEAEIRLAEAAIRSAEENLRGIEAIALKAKQIEPTSILEFMRADGVEAMVESAQLSLEKEKFGLEQAQGKLIVLDQFTKAKTIKELRSDVERAYSDELAKEQTLKLRGDQIASRKRAIELFKSPQESMWAPVVKALGEIIGLEAELQARLKEGPPADPKDRAGWEEKSSTLSSRLRAGLDNAEQLRDDIDFGRLGRSIHEAQRAGSGSLLERLRAIAPEDRKALFSSAPEQRDAILRKAGFTESEIERFKEMQAHGKEK
ncbi:hypothetical protein [Paludisphaera borealis]|uniref:Chromosome partition protein Smc n=1 Tax=Paludisphaera borealis TaxID=1387353 RepID=A0A1U7CPF5_9BACT|nr:hypothetical protein [Paludisphaera borealis]APW60801.1 hypothetical protein BSF38_02290 [Paludisphaera borealis]